MKIMKPFFPGLLCVDFVVALSKDGTCQTEKCVAERRKSDCSVCTGTIKLLFCVHWTSVPGGKSCVSVPCLRNERVCWRVLTKYLFSEVEKWGFSDLWWFYFCKNVQKLWLIYLNVWSDWFMSVFIESFLLQMCLFSSCCSVVFTFVSIYNW